MDRRHFCRCFRLAAVGAFAGVVLSVATGCASAPAAGRVVGPGFAAEVPTWSAEQLAQPDAAHPVSDSESYTCYIARRAEASIMHAHDDHEVTIHVSAGSGTVHFDNWAAQSFGPGDLILVPRGTAHRIELAEGSEALVGFVFIAPQVRDDGNWTRVIEPDDAAAGE